MLLQVKDLGENKTELDIRKQTGAASPVMQMQDCQLEQGAEAETLNLPINLCSNRKLEQQVLASDQQNEAINASGWNEAECLGSDVLKELGVES